MESNYLTPNPIPVPPDKEQEPAILFLDARNFAGPMESQPAQVVIQVVGRFDDKALDQHQTVQLQGIRHEQQVRLVGKPYSMYDDVDYFLAISG
ncbi:MAG TPA: hypothetical protein VK671_09635 [Mucilaginibacter sp.]|jgi:hypothetical protein|nr:hypothetical protein [Mucilaginibacter sp.]